MKHFIISFLTLITMQPFMCYGTMITGTLNKDVITPNRIDTSPLNYIQDAQDYTNGGVTFNYPAGFFTMPPVVQVSIQQNSSHPLDEVFVAEVSANSTTSTTVMVYHLSTTLGIVSIIEAPISSITVCLLAIEDSP